MRQFILLALAICLLATTLSLAQNYTDPFAPDVQIIPLLPDFTQTGDLPWDPTGTAPGVAVYGQATCYDGPFNSFGFMISGRLSAHNTGYPNCGDAHYEIDASSLSFRPDNVLDHLFQGWSALMDTSEPYSFNSASFYEACSLWSNVGLGQGGIYVQIRRDTICTPIPPGPPN